MSSFSSAHEQSSLVEDARIVQSLREFWKSNSDIRTDSIWSNIESAIQPGDSSWGKLRFGPLEMFRKSALVGYASITALVVITVLAGTLLYATQLDSARPSGAIVFSQTFAENVSANEQFGIPGYTAAIVQYRESLVTDEIVAFGSVSEVVVPVVIELTDTSSGVNAPGIVSSYQQVNPIESEELIASISMLGIEQSDQIAPVIGNVGPVQDFTRFNSDIVDASTSVTGNSLTGSQAAFYNNGVIQTTDSSARANSGIPESNGGSGAVIEPGEETSTSDGDVPTNDDAAVVKNGTNETDIENGAGEVAQIHEGDVSPDAEAGYADESSTDDIASDQSAANEPISPEPVDDPVLDESEPGPGRSESDNGHKNQDTGNKKSDSSGSEEEGPTDQAMHDEPVVEDPVSPELVEDPIPTNFERGSEKSNPGDGHGNKNAGAKKVDSQTADSSPVIEESRDGQIPDDETEAEGDSSAISTDGESTVDDIDAPRGKGKKRDHDEGDDDVNKGNGHGK